MTLKAYSACNWNFIKKLSKLIFRSEFISMYIVVLDSSSTLFRRTWIHNEAGNKKETFPSSFSFSTPSICKSFKFSFFRPTFPRKFNTSGRFNSCMTELRHFSPFMLDGGSNKDYKLSSLLPGRSSIRSGNYVHVWKHSIAMMLLRHFGNEVTTSCYLSLRKDENDPKFLFADDKKSSQSSEMLLKCFRRLFNVLWMQT